MERQPTYDTELQERIDATELKGGEDVHFRMGNPNHKSIEEARRDAAAALEGVNLAIKEVIPQPHEYPRSYGRSLKGLRIRKLGHAPDQPHAGISWDSFEATK